MFDLLTETKSLFNGDKDRFALRMYKIDHNIIEFIQNFFIGFFRNGYGINIDGVNPRAANDVNNHFRFSHTKPIAMINLFNEAIQTIASTKEATYSSSISSFNEKELKKAFDEFIPRLLKNADDEFKVLNAIELHKKNEQTLRALWPQKCLVKIRHSYYLFHSRSYSQFL